MEQGLKLLMHLAKLLPPNFTALDLYCDRH